MGNRSMENSVNGSLRYPDGSSRPERHRKRRGEREGGRGGGMITRVFLTQKARKPTP